MDAKPIYIFDAGGTKTDVLIKYNNQITSHTLSGYNPNRLDTYFNREVVRLDIPENALIYFYGSGINNQIAVKQVKNLFRSTNIHVEGDILGAARAAFNKSEGIVCILGTGGICAQYNGEKIIRKNGGYGFLIDDLGGGLELSKVVVSNWLNGNYSEYTTKAIENYFEVSKNDFIPIFYQTKNLHKLANLCSIIIDLSLKDITLNQSIGDYFDSFIERHVKPICNNSKNDKITIIGSIATYFNDWIIKSALKHKIEVAEIIQKPIHKLLDYHQ